jgi:HlyD family secretion protein
MKVWKKVAIGVGVLVVAGGIVSYSVKQANKDVVTVQSAKVGKLHLVTQVTASGEVKPKTYTNVLAEGIGRIIDIPAKEGDHVKRGDILMRVESTQPAADVQAQNAGISSVQSALESSKANYSAAQSDVKSAQSNLSKAQLDWDRGQSLYQQGLIPKQDFDSRKAAYDSAVAAVNSANARVSQSKADMERAGFIVSQNQAMLIRSRDILNKTTYRAPIDGVVTYIAVRVGENVVPGIQNATGSYLMTISDMSVVTAEVKVDETDIINLRPGQKATVTIDALPGQTFTGKVGEVGTQAVLRSSGLATTQSTTGSQEAKDFKVTVVLDNPPTGMRPGLSATAKITTAEKDGVLAIPIQALAIRSRKQLEDAAKQAASKGAGDTSVTLAAAKPEANTTDSKKDDIQGVFVIREGKAMFVQVQTGISGITDIEVLGGLKEGDQIVTGSYKALRTLRPNTPVKVDNSAPTPGSETT